MSDSVAWCILAGFKITSVFSRIIYHTIETVCEFAASVLQGYIYGGKNSVNFNVAKKTNQRKRKSSIKLIDESRNKEEPKTKNFYCKTNESIMSKNMSSTDMNKDMLTISGQRFCFHGTDKIIECNLHDARKVTVSFDFYPSHNQSMLEFFGSPKHGAPDPQKEVVENNFSVNAKMSTDPKQANGQLNQNEIARDASKFKYDESKLTDEIIFNTDSSKLATKKDLEVASKGRDVSINGCGASYKEDGHVLSDEQHLEPSVVHLSQDPESLFDKRVTHEDSTDSADKQWPKNHTFGKKQKSEISFEHLRDKKQDSKILADEEMRATTTVNQRHIYIANDPEHSGKNQTTSPIREKQIQETLSEKQQSDIKKDILIHSEQFQTQSAPAPTPITLTVSHTDKSVQESMAYKKKKPLGASTTDKNNRHEPESPTERKPMLASPVNKINPMPESTADKHLISESFVGKKPELVALANKNETSTPSPAPEKKTTADSLANKGKKPVRSPEVEKKPVRSPEADQKPVPALATEKTTPECAANNDKKLVPTPAANKKPVQAPETNKGKSMPVPTADQKLKPESPANKDKKPAPAADKKPIPPTAVKNPVPESMVDQKRTPESPTSNAKKPVPMSTADKKPAAEKSVPVPTVDNKPMPESPANKHKKPMPAKVAGKTPIPALETDKTIPEFDANNNRNPVPTPAASKTVPVPETIKVRALSAACTVKKLTPEYPANKDKKPVPASAAGKKSTPECPTNDKKPATDKKPVAAPAADKKPVAAPAADKKPVAAPAADKKPVAAPAADKKPVAAPAADKKPVAAPAADKKLTPESPAKKDKKAVPALISQKNASSAPVSLANQKSASESLAEEKNTSIPESTIDKHIPSSAIDKKPVSDTQSDSYGVEYELEVPEKLENTTKAASKVSEDSDTVESNCKGVQEINESGNIDSSLNKEFGTETQPIDTGGSGEEFSGDFDEMLEKGPSIVIAPDILLNPIMPPDAGIYRQNASNIEMNPKYMQDGWDDSDKCFYEYVIEREKEMEQFDPSSFESECSDERDRFDENKTEGEEIQRDSPMSGGIIDKYNPMTEVPKYYDLIRVVDSKYVLEKSLIKCYKKLEVIDNFESAEVANNTDDSDISSKVKKQNTQKQSTRETGNVNISVVASSSGESSVTLQESQKNVKTFKELGARPKTYPPGSRK